MQRNFTTLNVPFRSQHDGSPHADSNCGPAALGMALAVFGVKSDTAVIRARADVLDAECGADDGVTLSVLGAIAAESGLEPITCANWSLDTLRWHVAHGHPVVVAATYRKLTGHAECANDGEHCVLVTGLTADGFVYSDPDFKSRARGSAIKITADAFEMAWTAAGRPEALALAAN